MGNSYSLNQNVNERDEIIFGEKYDEDKYFGGCRSFSGLSFNSLKELLSGNYIDLEENTNGSPTTEEFYDYMQRHQDFTCHGYAVSPSRPDYRVTIEGLNYDGPTSIDMILEFVDLFRFADDFLCSASGLYCWYD